MIVNYYPPVELVGDSIHLGSISWCGELDVIGENSNFDHDTFSVDLASASLDCIYQHFNTLHAMQIKNPLV